MKFSIYNVSQLQGINSKEFRDHIDKKLGTIDSLIEGFSDDELDKQRDLTVKFYWGHNHDFGDFKVNDNMGDRHIILMAYFLKLFDIDIQYFHQKKVFIYWMLDRRNNLIACSFVIKSRCYRRSQEIC